MFKVVELNFWSELTNSDQILLILLILLILISTCTLGTANREENYQQKSEEFEKHSKKMAATAAALAKSGVITDRKLADDLISTSAKVRGCGLHFVHIPTSSVVCTIHVCV